jgi:hypothetical protein
MTSASRAIRSTGREQHSVADLHRVIGTCAAGRSTRSATTEHGPLGPRAASWFRPDEPGRNYDASGMRRRRRCLDSHRGEFGSNVR